MCSLPDRGRGPVRLAATAPLRWRVLEDEPLPGAGNMARDHALATLARPGAGTLRFYRWSSATLSFGRNEAVGDGYRDLLRRRPEMRAVRRPTGGRAVLHDRELTYSVVLPARVLGGLRPAYRRINGGLVEGLRRLGVDAALVSSSRPSNAGEGQRRPGRRGQAARAAGRTRGPGSGPCFLDAAEGEVVVGGRKLVGSAQARIGDAILQHGSLLLVADQEPLLDERSGRREGPTADDGVVGNGRRRPATLAEVLGEVPAWSRLVAALAAGFENLFGGRWNRGSMTGGELALAAKLEERYASREWTWRR